MYPGTRIDEEGSGARTIIGVATSTTAFIGRALRGAANVPVVIHGFDDYQREFGGLWGASTMSYAVHQYYANGGRDAVIVRVHNGASAARIAIPGPPGTTHLLLEAANPGGWGDRLRARVDIDAAAPADSTDFDLFIEELDQGSVPPQIRLLESFRDVSVDPAHPRFVQRVLAQDSRLARVASVTARPPAGTYTVTTAGSDGTAIGANEVSTGPALESDREGIWALEDADIFNLLCIPPFERGGDIDDPTRSAAIDYCKRRRAIFLLDPPVAWTSKAEVVTPVTGIDAFAPFRGPNVAVYWPHVRVPDPLKENQLDTFAPCGVAAGVIARTDRQRGVWKAPAGRDATLIGVSHLACVLTDRENSELDPFALNCLRTFPAVGSVVWGARTFSGADRPAPEWKYLPVRRLALFIEETLLRGTQWVVFEPNDEPLWSQIRLDIGAFMHQLFRQGAFQGQTPNEAYMVKCDRETTTQADIDAGIVNILVGFAPIKRGEFVIITIRQLAGQTTP